MDLSRVTTVMSRKQLRSIVEAERAPIALWDGAVSSGKTIASLIRLLIAITTAPDHGLIIVVGRTLQTIERNVIDPLCSPHLFGPLARHVHHTTGSTTAVILGRTVHLIGATDVRAEGRIRGATVALAYVDEATLVPRSFWMMLLSRLRVGDASRLIATTNPDGPAHWLRADFILRADEVGLRRWAFRLDDNPSLDPEYVARLKRQYTGLWYRRFILGEWCLAEGAVYDCWDPARHVVTDLPPIARWIGLGIDYGTRNPFAALLLGLGTDGRLYVAAEWRYDSTRSRRQLTDAEYSQRLRDWLATVPIPGGNGLTGVDPEWWVVDPSAASFRTQLFRDHVQPVRGNNSMLDGIRRVHSLLAADLLRVHESCTGLINEIPGYSWDPKRAEQGEDVPIKVDDHSLDGLRYAVHTTEAAWRPHLTEAA